MKPRKSVPVSKNDQRDESKRRNSTATALVLIAFFLGILGNVMGENYRGVESLADAAAAALVLVAIVIVLKGKSKSGGSADPSSRHRDKPGEKDASR